MQLSHHWVAFALAIQLVTSAHAAEEPKQSTSECLMDELDDLVHSKRRAIGAGWEKLKRTKGVVKIGDDRQGRDKLDKSTVYSYAEAIDRHSSEAVAFIHADWIADALLLRTRAIASDMNHVAVPTGRIKWLQNRTGIAGPIPEIVGNWILRHLSAVGEGFLGGIMGSIALAPFLDDHGEGTFAASFLIMQGVAATRSAYEARTLLKDYNDRFPEAFWQRLEERGIDVPKKDRLEWFSKAVDFISGTNHSINEHTPPAQFYNEIVHLEGLIAYAEEQLETRDPARKAVLNGMLESLKRLKPSKIFRTKGWVSKNSATYNKIWKNYLNVLIDGGHHDLVRELNLRGASRLKPSEDSDPLFALLNPVRDVDSYYVYKAAPYLLTPEVERALKEIQLAGGSTQVEFNIEAKVPIDEQTTPTGLFEITMTAKIKPTEEGPEQTIRASFNVASKSNLESDLIKDGVSTWGPGIAEAFERAIEGNSVLEPYLAEAKAIPTPQPQFQEQDLNSLTDPGWEEKGDQKDKTQKRLRSED